MPHFGGRSVQLSPLQAVVLEVLVDNFGELVAHEDLQRRVAVRGRPDPSRNAMHIQMMRVRRRIASLGLAVTTVWGRGYVPEPGPWGLLG
ncbi:helix-turn-helix domain-containing protein [Streptomyces naphthomycinicus]|uniref:helix-turn-helix domain-containing protein n=1 Tax=Streptomyces naphthomycinicus TaxID=2872625 RepID=UPI001CECEF65|nr:helix-turn-helix domain-containing protein [Streptomyces sp. TML10]